MLLNSAQMCRFLPSASDEIRREMSLPSMPYLRPETHGNSDQAGNLPAAPAQLNVRPRETRLGQKSSITDCRVVRNCIRAQFIQRETVDVTPASTAGQRPVCIGDQRRESYSAVTFMTGGWPGGAECAVPRRAL